MNEIGVPGLSGVGGGGGGGSGGGIAVSVEVVVVVVDGGGDGGGGDLWQAETLDVHTELNKQHTETNGEPA